MFRFRITDGGLNRSGIDDKNNCTIVALAVTSRISYKRAYRIGETAGRKRGKGFLSSRLIYEARRHGIHAHAIPLPTRRFITAERFVELHPKGRFYVRGSCHAFAIINGVPYDQSLVGPGTRITDAWLIERPPRSASSRKTTAAHSQPAQDSTPENHPPSLPINDVHTPEVRAVA
jgi:hypothetical protein